jgi:outer membrane lipoprotein-sorting protein
MSTHTHRRALAILGLALACAWIVPSSAQAADDPWAVLRGVRDSLADSGPTVAKFTQTFIPAGFSSGQQESGQMAVALPDCLRFDYDEPYEKSLLLCGETAHYWVPEDRTGRRYGIDRDEEPGLDLVLLGVDQLEDRYDAKMATASGGRRAVILRPRQQRGELVEATLTVDPKSQRLVAVAYKDLEGNETRFQITGYRNLSDGDRFRPPSGITWRDE